MSGATPQVSLEKEAAVAARYARAAQEQEAALRLPRYFSLCAVDSQKILIMSTAVTIRGAQYLSSLNTSTLNRRLSNMASYLRIISSITREVFAYTSLVLKGLKNSWIDGANKLLTG